MFRLEIEKARQDLMGKKYDIIREKSTWMRFFDMCPKDDLHTIPQTMFYKDEDWSFKMTSLFGMNYRIIIMLTLVFNVVNFVFGSVAVALFFCY